MIATLNDYATGAGKAPTKNPTLAGWIFSFVTQGQYLLGSSVSPSK